MKEGSIVATNDQWVVWVSQDAGRQILGLGDQGDQRQTRFSVIGLKAREAFNFGLWLEVEAVEEWAVPENIVIGRWTVSPKKCLLPFQLIQYIQLNTTGREKIGFSKTNSK